MAPKQKTTAQIRAERPLSPHLTIYKPQITSMLSITHRLTGLFNALGLVIFAWWILSLALGPDAFHYFSTFFACWCAQLLLVGWTLSIAYHLSNGIRHLVWDTGAGLSLEAATISGITVLITTILLTALVWQKPLMEWLR